MGKKTFLFSVAGLSLAAALAAPLAAGAQTVTTPPSTPPPTTPPPTTEIVVTGSRIARTNVTQVQPVTVITGEDIHDRGFANLADIINQLPAAGAGITPIGDQNDFGVGRNYIDLFSLGSNRTLTLVNGLRYVGDNPTNIFANEGGNQVDIHALPTLFVDSIETVPATGAAVYGSDAVSGVVNIIMKKHFEGAEFTAQSGISTYGDASRYTAEGAVGHNFLNDRLNVAVDFQYDHTNPLTAGNRPYTAEQNGFVANPAYTGQAGVPAEIVAPNLRFSGITLGGLPLQLDGQTPIYLPGTNTIAQFAKNGNLVAFNPGTVYGGGFLGGSASGGDSLNEAPLAQLQTPLDRKVLTFIASYEITPHIKAYFNLSYSNNGATETVNQPNYSASFFGVASGYNSPQAGNALLISSQNAFLTPQAQSVLAANGVGDFYLNRANVDISPDPIKSSVETINGSVQVVGDFNALDRDFDWNLSYVHGVSYSRFDQDNLVYGNPAYNVPDLFGYAVDSIIGANGQPECRIKAQNPTSTNPAIANCVPFDPFGVNNNTKAALAYFTADFGNHAMNEQDDAQANFGGTVFKLPGGDWKVTTGFEFRREMATFTPSTASAEGIGYSVPISGQIGAYHTDEIYAETLIPILGPGFNLPFAQKFSLQGAYREVWNSIAGYNTAWSYGAQFSPVPDITLRGSRSKTFRDPSLEELFSATTNAYDYGSDPCQVSNISSGPNPKVREANCAKAFAALGANLSTFTNSFVSDYTIPVTAGGNPELKNEVGQSETYGVVLQPRYVPHLTLSADYIEINITNAIEYFGVGNLMEACYDSPNYPNTPACNDFQRQPGTGQIVSAQEGYVNAGFVHFAAVNYALDYLRAINQLPFVNTTRDLGTVGLSINGVNIRRSIQSYSGLGYDDINSAGTIGIPRWRWQAELTYAKGPWRLGWTAHYFSASAYDLTLTPSDQEPLKVPESLTHDFSLNYKIQPKVTLRLNINNVFNATPPAPVGTYTDGYYDFIGRYFLFGIDGKF
jgi:outer membrane receptor protein involved in Fe transport